MHDAVPDHRYHLAGDSIWPFLAGGRGRRDVRRPRLPPDRRCPIGAGVPAVHVLGWFWPSKEPEPIHHPRTRPAGEARRAMIEPADDRRLPPAGRARDTRSPAWWGNTLFMCIETSDRLPALASYFYLWRNYPQEQWPPPRVDQEPTILNPVPDLLSAR